MITLIRLETNAIGTERKNNKILFDGPHFNKYAKILAKANIVINERKPLHTFSTIKLALGKNI